MLNPWYLAAVAVVAAGAPVLAFASWLCFCAWVTKTTERAPSIIRAAGRAYPLRRIPRRWRWRK